MSKSNIVFGKWEITAFMINAMTVQVYIGFPRRIAEIGGTAAWLVVILMVAFVILWFAFIARLFSKFEGKDILDISDYLAGKAGRIITGILFAAYIVFLNSLTLREFAEDMKIISLKTTPISFITLLFVAGMIFAIFMGLEAIVRLHAISVPIILAGFLVIIIGVSQYYDLTNLMPVMGNGPSKILSGGLINLSMFSALSIIYILFPFVQKNKIFKASGFIAIIASSAIMLMSVLSYTLVFPYPTSISNSLPVFQMARLISYGRFFTRIESVFVFIWAASALLYLSGALFVGIYMVKKTFRLKYYRPLILPFAIIVFALSILPPSLMETIAIDMKYVRPFAFAMTFGLVLIILLAASVKKSREKARAS